MSMTMSMNTTKYNVDVVLGSQLGDEGKGRLIDILASKYDIVARCNSGGNAGHKVVVGDKSYAFHLIPSGILNPNCIGIIGNGCVINLQDLRTEIETIQNTDPDNKATNDITKRLLISDRAHIVLNAHKEADAARELQKSNSSNPKSVIGTTKQGMGPVYSSKALRVGLRMCDLFLEKHILEEKVKGLVFELENTLGYSIDIIQLMQDIKNEIEFYRPMVIDTITYLNNAINKGSDGGEGGGRVLVEIAQACLLDVDFGVYPYCTATNCSVGAVCSGLGIPANCIGTINYVLKTYCTRVGNGPFPTELLCELGNKLQVIGREFGTTTSRKRRCGWLDIPMVKWATMINGTDNATLCLIKLDVLDTFEEIKLAVAYKIDGREVCGFPSSLEKLAKVEVEYEVFDGWMTPTTEIRNFNDLPINAKKYLKRIEELIGIPIKFIGVGAEREAMIQIE